MKNKKGIIFIVTMIIAASIAVESAVAVTADSAVILGDADGDNDVTITDATAIQRHLAEFLQLDGDALRAADADRDNSISILDATCIQRYLASLEVIYPIGAPLPDESATEEATSEIQNGMPAIAAGQTAVVKSLYTDSNGDSAVIPTAFTVSAKADEQTIAQGLVITGPDGSEFVWVPTAATPLTMRNFGSYFSGGSSLSGYYDETDLDTYKEMEASVEEYGGFYMGRFEASQGENNLPVSKRITDSTQGRIWVQFSPQDATIACQKMYEGNDDVQGFFPWGANWDTTLQWLIDSGCKIKSEITSDSTSWGNYSNDTFSEGARGNTTGMWEEAKANNIYDLAGNNWEWTQERYGSGNYVMRGGGYNLMGGACPGNYYPAAIRDPLPGNNHHPNVVFRAALYIK